MLRFIAILTQILHFHPQIRTVHKQDKTHSFTLMCRPLNFTVVHKNLLVLSLSNSHSHTHCTETKPVVHLDGHSGGSDEHGGQVRV